MGQTQTARKDNAVAHGSVTAGRASTGGNHQNVPDVNGSGRRNGSRNGRATGEGRKSIDTSDRKSQQSKKDSTAKLPNPAKESHRPGTWTGRGPGPRHDQRQSMPAHAVLEARSRGPSATSVGLEPAPTHQFAKEHDDSEKET